MPKLLFKKILPQLSVDDTVYQKTLRMFVSYLILNTRVILRNKISRMVQFAYHLFPLFFYDKIPIKYPDRIVKYVLATQNKVGGFGVQLNSSACEDIDSIDLLCRFSPFVSEQQKKEIDKSLKKALNWVLCNQVKDGGFVFRLYEPFKYGHKETSSTENQGGLFPTWFRILSLAYLARYFKSCPFYINYAPGLEN